MIVTAYNPSTENLEKSSLSQAYAAGVTSIVVRNNDSFATNDRILIGEMGREGSEIVTVSAVNADKITMTVGATKFPHSADDPVYQLRYDQIKFYRSTTVVDGAYTILATVGVDVDNSEKETRYNDTTGLSSYFYKITYYHSITGVESELSDPIPATGYTRQQVGAVVNDFLTEVDDLQQKYMTVPEIVSLMNEVNDDLGSQSRRPYRFQKTSSLLSIIASNDRVALPTTMQKFDRINYNYNFLGENRKDDIRLITMTEMEYLKYDQTAVADNNLQYLAIDETTNELVLFPTPATSQTSVFKIFFWQKFPVIDSLGDTILPPSPRIYKLLLLSRFYRRRAVKEQQFLSISDRYSQDYSTEVVKLQRYNKLDIGTPPGMRPGTGTARGLRKY